jgi:hypothetical protein
MRLRIGGVQAGHRAEIRNQDFIDWRTDLQGSGTSRTTRPGVEADRGMVPPAGFGMPVGS